MDDFAHHNSDLLVSAFLFTHFAATDQLEHSVSAVGCVKGTIEALSDSNQSDSSSGECMPFPFGYWLVMLSVSKLTI